MTRLVDLSIPLEYCHGDGVVLDFTQVEKGHVISAAEVEGELDCIGYALKERDIVLIHTGAGAHNDEERYKTDHLMNLEQIGRPFGFKLSVLPVKWVGTTAAPVRAVAILEDE